MQQPCPSGDVVGRSVQQPRRMLLYLRASTLPPLRGGCCIFVQQGEVAVYSCSKGRLLYLRAATPALRGGCCNSVQQPRLLDTAPGGLPATSTECMGESIQTSKLRPPHRPPHYAPAPSQARSQAFTHTNTVTADDSAALKRRLRPAGGSRTWRSAIAPTLGRGEVVEQNRRAQHSATTPT